MLLMQPIMNRDLKGYDEAKLKGSIFSIFPSLHTIQGYQMMNKPLGNQILHQQKI